MLPLSELILRSRLLKFKVKRLECKFGILLDNKGLKLLHKRIIKERWVLSWFIPLMIYSLLMRYKTG